MLILKGVTNYSRQELEVACEDFSNIIGSSLGSLVYKGNMKNGLKIAIISICIIEAHWTDYLELYYQKEVKPLTASRHLWINISFWEKVTLMLKSIRRHMQMKRLHRRRWKRRWLLVDWVLISSWHQRG